MFTRSWFLLRFAALLSIPVVLSADIVVPGANGTDGSLVITANTVIDLSQAVTGVWDQDNTANAGKGVYDPGKWAVVFKYNNVQVNAGATVTFTNHPSRAPVVWLVSGNVTIAGTVSLNGANFQTPPSLSEPGPGGFRGGNGYFSSGVVGGSGFGVGGGSAFYGGSYGSQGGSGPSTFGNPSNIPLIGGAGGGGDSDSAPSGGAGGGAILIASTSMNLTGTVRANGGSGNNTGFSAYNQSGGGSGGAIRIVCDSFSGVGALNAIGGGGFQSGGVGRIRIERITNTGSVAVVPDASVVALTDGATALIWPPEGAPKVSIVSVRAVIPPADPRASFGADGADVTISQATTIPVVIRTENVESTAQVQVRITPRSNANFTTVNATFTSADPVNPAIMLWTANVPTNVGYSALQVKVVRP